MLIGFMLIGSVGLVSCWIGFILIGSILIGSMLIGFMLIGSVGLVSCWIGSVVLVPFWMMLMRTKMKMKMNIKTRGAWFVARGVWGVASSSVLSAPAILMDDEDVICYCILIGIFASRVCVRWVNYTASSQWVPHRMCSLSPWTVS